MDCRSRPACTLSPWVNLDDLERQAHANVRSDPYATPNALYLVRQLQQQQFGEFKSLVDGDLVTLPPTLVQAGGLEILAADALSLGERLAAAGVDCQVRVWPGQMHVFPLLADLLPEGRLAVVEAANFLRRQTLSPERGR
ncbi:alpha/beta hydrolase [Pseudonocardiaceae bacterium YIM PH 21723]|nr:alpha/beta hydrolase [Pseudonocardiaceae bacterium YIM PH 21723]